MSLRRARLLLALALLSLLCRPALADQVTVAVAANFAAPVQTIAAAFERSTGHRAVISLGATGKFYTQITNGAPFDVLLAADEDTPTRLVTEGAAVSGTQFVYAVGKLVLWSAKPGLVDEQGEVLTKGGFEHLSYCNPKLAPYGQAAVETMKALGVYDQIRPRLVEGENVAQAYQFVVSGNAELGFVALSQVSGNGKIRDGSAWVVPAKYHRPLRQAAVILRNGRDNPAARAWMQWLAGAEARATIR